MKMEMIYPVSYTHLDVCFVIEKDKKNIEDLQKRLQQLHMEILNAKVEEKDDC